MTQPPDFVLYVVMVKTPDSKVFNPCWGTWGNFFGAYAKGFARKADANRHCKAFRAAYGKKNAYVQQYGPYRRGVRVMANPKLAILALLLPEIEK